MEAPGSPSRRRFLGRVTLALGGLVGAVLTVPLVRHLLAPVGVKTVTSSRGRLDAIAVDALPADGTPVQVALVAPEARDGWTVHKGAPVGSAWVRRGEGGASPVAFSAVCPHLGCSVGYDAEARVFRCPCHRSAFGLDGDRKAGPSRRGLDPLPVAVEDGRVKITFRRFRLDVAERVEV
jgi:menaquinol-cytochrome c reductase iron-sulfur subunit